MTLYVVALLKARSDEVPLINESLMKNMEMSKIIKSSFIKLSLV